MSLDKLSISYRCHNSIGNSLDISDMLTEVIETFAEETDALHGSFYIIEENTIYKNIISIGKKISLDIFSIKSKLAKSEIFIEKYDEKINILACKLEEGCMFFAYDFKDDVDFITSIYESFKSKLNISINSCLSVQKLKESNIKLLEQKRQLEVLTNSLKDEIELATKLSIEKEKQIFEQIKMAQMGELIGNIAHQWREPLSVISTAASGMKIKKEHNMLTDPDFSNYTQSIVDNSLYLSNTIDEFRDYIKESHREKEIVIQERLKMAITLVESSFSLENIQIIQGFIEEKDIHFKLILGDLLQVLISILNNSKDALIINKVENRWIKYELIKKENIILITIEDNAGGIEKNILDKIFNPYFTTKHQFEGTGVGLYSGYDIIVNKLKGNLYVKNTQHGAKFYIELPISSNYVI
ncbi:sensor histidine kinase [Arcobacter sp. LA11]|uniref:sensor histidine kinase n=1 Tax=Arcobacter sp. LA11 TaxID=1898176 RepID=UPI0009328590|nr:HAMP domain-containing sensor histidine kinase [Arcobacter sp. LA11]